ncbi:hypothetical protein LQG66_04785 [Bradyrhizobium ontarionense]|uniref:YggT family protein n=1 Tax=Bradyrhizobium ontarionense TaxID=2898149 RepID=A0ABY3RDX9_9BRAD|nr:hypothetical protein [Bradyrhizobium sp. A19]UFZ05634.1 hypothetical protein LQG66_04785 [Bradyrhizobium sp. A19]
MEFGQLFLDLVVEVLIAIRQLGTLSGRMLYAALGLTPSPDIMFLTGLSLWALIGAIAYWAWLS